VDKIVITINPKITVSPVIKVSFPINVTTVVKLFDRLVKVVKKNDKI
jgi:hypothetical protein